MTDQQHPITPPPELQEEWLGLWPQDALLQAARWGADQELEACCEWLKAKEWIHPEFSDELRAARRPKPKSLAEEALEAFYRQVDGALTPESQADADTICRALERLQELEGQADD